MKEVSYNELELGNEYILVHKNRNGLVDEVYKVLYIDDGEPKQYVKILRIYKYCLSIHRSIGDIVDILSPMDSNNPDKFYEVNDDSHNELMAMLL